MLILLILVVGAIVWLVRWVLTRNQPPAVQLPPPLPGFGPGYGPGRGFGPGHLGHDEALAHVRLRYARGELSRDEFLRIAADLGAPLESGLPGGPSPV